jgi:hypothetical protein
MNDSLVPSKVWHLFSHKFFFSSSSWSAPTCFSVLVISSTIAVMQYVQAASVHRYVQGGATRDLACHTSSRQGCQMCTFSNLGSFWRVLPWKMLVHLINFADIMYTYFIGIWYNFWLFDVFFPFWYVVQRKIWQPCLSDSVQIFWLMPLKIFSMISVMQATTVVR